MDMGFDHNGFATSAFGAGLPLDADRLEWGGLLARLAAAYQARRAIVALGEAEPDRLGSFDARAAAALATRETATSNGSRSVNQTALADGKVPQGIGTDVAGLAADDDLRTL
jgi:hypothetical protein